MPDPEQMHQQLTSGAVGRIRATSDDAFQAASKVDEARDSIAHGVGTPLWSGFGANQFQERGKNLFVSAGGTSWGLCRTAEFLTAAADAYRDTIDSADHTIGVWRRRDGAEDNQALRTAVVAALDRTRAGWEAWLRQAAGSLDDDGGSAFRDWLEQGQGHDFDFMNRTGATRGFRIPASLVNGDDDGWTQQGLAHSRHHGLYAVTSYRDEDNRTGDGVDDPDDSLLSLVDDTSGRELANVRLTGPGGVGAPSHSGGVAINGNDVYVVGGGKIYRYSLSQVRAAERGEPVEASWSEDVPASSYVTVAEGSMWLGDFGGEELKRVDLDQARSGQFGDYDTYSAPEGANGVIVRPDGFVFTDNDGRDGPSQLLSYPRYDPGDSLPDGKDHVLGNMGEEAVVVNGRVVVMSESGADAYSPWDSDDDGGDDGGSEGKVDDLWAQTNTFSLPLDQVQSGQDFQVDLVSLDDARKVFLTASDQLDASAKQIAGTELPASSLGEVGAAAGFSAAVERYLDDCARHLREGVKASDGTADSLWNQREAYERADGSAASFFDRLEWAVSKPTGPPS